MRKFYVVLFFICLSDMAWSHGDLHQRILDVTNRIEKNPRDFELYRERGELYLKHQDHRNAIKDLSKCIRREGPTDRLNYGLALAYYGMSRYQKTIRLLEDLLKESADPKVFRLLARASQASGREQMSVIYFRKVIDHTIRPRPENYLELADAVAALQDRPLRISVLLEGIQRLGLIPSLTGPLLDIYMRMGAYDQAIALQTKIVNHSFRKEFALVKRAEMYCIQLKYDRASDDLKQASTALQGRPKHARLRSVNVALASKIRRLKQDIRNK